MQSKSMQTKIQFSSYSGQVGTNFPNFPFSKLNGDKITHPRARLHYGTVGRTLRSGFSLDRKIEDNLLPNILYSQHGYQYVSGSSLRLPRHPLSDPWLQHVSMTMTIGY